MSRTKCLQHRQRGATVPRPDELDKTGIISRRFRTPPSSVHLVLEANQLT